jgi:hypothetical protein
MSISVPRQKCGRAANVRPEKSNSSTTKKKIIPIRCPAGENG